MLSLDISSHSYSYVITILFSFQFHSPLGLSLYSREVFAPQPPQADCPPRFTDPPSTLVILIWLGLI